MTDDHDKDEGIPDPWAGLESASEGDAREEFAFSFEALEIDAAAEELVEEAAAVIEDPIDAAAGGGPEGPVAEAVVEDEIAGWLEQPAAEATDRDDGEPGADHVDVMTFADGGVDDAEPEEAFAELDTDETDLEPAAVLALGGSQVAQAVSRPKSKKKSGLGFLGPILGGLLSLPIVFSILLGLLWGTGRDPIGMRSWLPSFLLPSRNGARGMAETSVADTKPPSLDDLAQSESTPGATAATEPLAPTPESSSDPVPPANEISAPMIESPRIEDPLPAAVPVVPSVAAADPAAVMPPPPASPLPDLSRLETAVEDALASMDVVVGSQDGEPAERRRALVAWYKSLARVGTEMALLETAAADSGRPLDETPAPVMTLYERLVSSGGLTPDLKRLCRNWVDYTKRPADGVLLVGVLDAARQVGPFWYTTLFLEQVDGSMRTVSLISRRQPRADAGDRVAVAGVVFSEDMVWAADCGRLGAPSAPEPAVEDDPF